MNQEDLKKFIQNFKNAECDLFNEAACQVKIQMFAKFEEKQRIGFDGWVNCPVEVLTGRIAQNLFECQSENKDPNGPEDLNVKQYTNIHVLMAMLEARNIPSRYAMRLVTEQLLKLVEAHKNSVRIAYAAINAESLIAKPGNQRDFDDEVKKEEDPDHGCIRPTERPEYEEDDFPDDSMLGVESPGGN